MNDQQFSYNKKLKKKKKKKKKKKVNPKPWSTLNPTLLIVYVKQEGHVMKKGNPITSNVRK
jgi:hypothetical protein